MATLFVDKVDPQSGTALEIGSSGDTITIPSGATITNNGTQTGFGGVNTPAFSAERSGDQSISNGTRTTILFNNEFYDSSSAYDTSTGKFTPQVAGKYYVSANVQLTADNYTNLNLGFIELYKNAAVISEGVFDMRNNPPRSVSPSVIAIVDMNGSSDFLLIQAYVSETGLGGTMAVRDMSTFQAYKIIE